MAEQQVTNSVPTPARDQLKLSTLLPSRYIISGAGSTSLELQLFNADDDVHVATALKARNQPSTLAGVGDLGVHTREQLLERQNASQMPGRLIEHVLAAKTKETFNSTIDVDCAGTYIIFAVEQSGQRSPVGFVSVHRGLAEEREPGGVRYFPPDLGWNILESQQGRGFATTAMRGFLDMLGDTLGFGAVGAGMVLARIDVKNMASKRVAEKIGMSKLGTVRGRLKGGTLPGVDTDSVVEHMYYGIPADSDSAQTGLDLDLLMSYWAEGAIWTSTTGSNN